MPYICTPKNKTVNYLLEKQADVAQLVRAADL